MCSVCWQWRDKSCPDAPKLSIIFNRDEQRSRASAKIPSLQDIDGVQALMPIDPARGGTWISTNQYGLTIALLNNYAVSPSSDTNYQSRGFIVRTLSSYSSGSEAERALKQLLTTTPFPAFSLLMWDASEQSVGFYQWDEKELDSPKLELPFFTSSSWNTAKVQKFRTESYRDQVLKKSVPAVDFMSSCPEDKEMWAVFMSREKTQTLSISEIHIAEQQTEFSYFDRTSGGKSHHQISTDHSPAS